MEQEAEHRGTAKLQLVSMRRSSEAATDLLAALCLTDALLLKKVLITSEIMIIAKENINGLG